MSGRVFVDTNVLIYAHDIRAGQKQEKAAKVLSDLWEKRTGVLSTQVLQEFTSTLPARPPQPSNDPPQGTSSGSTLSGLWSSRMRT